MLENVNNALTQACANKNDDAAWAGLHDNLSVAAASCDDSSVSFLVALTIVLNQLETNTANFSGRRKKLLTKNVNSIFVQKFKQPGIQSKIKSAIEPGNKWELEAKLDLSC